MINQEQTKLQQLKELDYFGLLLYCSGLILLLLRFSKASQLLLLVKIVQFADPGPSLGTRNITLEER